MNPSSKLMAHLAGWLNGCSPGGLINTHGTLAPVQAMDLAHAAQLAKKSAGRRDLKRAHRHEQAGRQCMVGEIFKPVAHAQISAQRRLGLYAQSPFHGFITEGTGIQLPAIPGAS